MLHYQPPVWLQVTTLLSAAEGGAAAEPGASAEELQEAVSSQGAVVKAAKAKAKESGEEADQQAAKAQVDKLLVLKRQLSVAEEAAPPSLAPGESEYDKDFFGKPASLAVSGQLNGALRTLLDGCSNEQTCLLSFVVPPRHSVRNKLMKLTRVRT